MRQKAMPSRLFFRPSLHLRSRSGIFPTGRAERMPFPSLSRPLRSLPLPVLAGPSCSDAPVPRFPGRCALGAEHRHRRRARLKDAVRSVPPPLLRLPQVKPILPPFLPRWLLDFSWLRNRVVFYFYLYLYLFIYLCCFVLS